MKAVPIHLLAVVLFGTACGPALVIDDSKVVAAPPDAEQAIAVVVAFYGLRRVPDIHFYGGAALECGGNEYRSSWNGDCVCGEQEGDKIVIAYPDGAAMHDTCLTHETAHVASEERGEGGDHNHVGHFYRDPGEDLSLDYDNSHGDSGKARAELASLGM